MLNHSHFIMNRSRKPAWLKGFAMIVVSFTVSIYRQKSSLNAGVGYGTICAASIFQPYRRSRCILACLNLSWNALLFACSQRHATECSRRLLKPAQDGIANTL